MATRKQRARRAKTFRHEYGFEQIDEEGNKVELTGAEMRARKDGDTPSEKAKPAAAKGKPAGGRTLREPPPPSWERAAKRGALWGLPMVALMVVFLKSIPVPTRILFGVVYAVMFIPLTYWLDGMVYRRWQARQGGRTNRPDKTR
jgi:hypothetical protein